MIFSDENNVNYSWQLKIMSKKKLTAEQREELLLALEVRFEKNMKRHKGLEWSKVALKLSSDSDKL